MCVQMHPQEYEYPFLGGKARLHNACRFCITSTVRRIGTSQIDSRSLQDLACCNVTVDQATRHELVSRPHVRLRESSSEEIHSEYCMLTIPALRWEGPFHRPKHPRQHLKTEDLKSRVRVNTDACNP